jgi:hypothetical protein
MTATLALDQLTAIMITLEMVQQSLTLTHSHMSVSLVARAPRTPSTRSLLH